MKPRSPYEKPLDEKTIFALKACDIASAHLLEEHKRMQSEIYQRISYRQKTIELFFISGGIFLGAIGFLVKQYIGNEISIMQSYASVAFLCISLLGFAFICAILFNNYITHSGHIYAAAFYVCENIERSFQKIMQHAQDPIDNNERLHISVFKWEYVLNEKRNMFKFHDRFGDEYLLLGMPFVMLLFTSMLLIGFLYNNMNLYGTWFSACFIFLGIAVGVYHARTLRQYQMLVEFRKQIPR